MQKEMTLDPRDWEGVRALGHRIDDMLAHVRDVRERPAWQPMPESARAALATEVPTLPADIETIYADFLEHVLPYGLGNIHPRFWGWVIGTGTFSAALADFLAVAMNTNASGFATSLVVLEEKVLAWLREMLRLPDGRSGILVSGGSAANFQGIAAGMHAVLGDEHAKHGLVGMRKRPTVYASEATHFSVKRAVRLLGLGEASYRVMPCDEGHPIDVGALRAAIARDRVAGMRPCLIAANAGTVGIGGFDPLAALADVAAQADMWLHVDGAIGAILALTGRYAHMVAGIERADSVTFDLHKWLHAPIEAACIFIRDDEAHLAPCAVPGAYLSDMREGPATRLNCFTDLGLQQSRSARGEDLVLSARARPEATRGMRGDEHRAGGVAGWRNRGDAECWAPRARRQQHRVLPLYAGRHSRGEVERVQPGGTDAHLGAGPGHAFQLHREQPLGDPLLHRQSPHHLRGS